MEVREFGEDGALRFVEIFGYELEIRNILISHIEAMGLLVWLQAHMYMHICDVGRFVYCSENVVCIRCMETSKSGLLALQR